MEANTAITGLYEFRMSWSAQNHSAPTHLRLASSVSRFRIAALEALIKRPKVYECDWAHFAVEIHLSE